ncbi:hypothetical protein F4680DRAFT_417667 [Xylaria scruposa]|nr:hypothetical protein F4680DRAFT_417667 [Xylaria scruposa]
MLMSWYPRRAVRTCLSQGRIPTGIWGCMSPNAQSARLIGVPTTRNNCIFSIVISSLVPFLLFLDKSACSGPGVHCELRHRYPDNSTPQKTSDIGDLFFTRNVVISKIRDMHNGGIQPELNGYTALPGTPCLSAIQKQYYPTMIEIPKLRGSKIMQGSYSLPCTQDVPRDTVVCSKSSFDNEKGRVPILKECAS